MTPNAVETHGTLNADGTLVLDGRPNLPPGRVRVTLQPVEERVDVIEGLRRIHERLRASGHVPRSAEEIDAEIAASREEYEERKLEIERLHEECIRARQEQPPAGEAP